ncbi:MAG: hypothetical protein Q9191_004115 [Dirinaria sp. TL-2023a]
MPTTGNSILTTSVNDIHTLAWLQRLVRHQAEEYLASHPYYLEHSNPWLHKNLNRLVSQELIKPRRKDATPTFGDIMHEDLLLTISDNLFYRKTLMEQATGYKNEIFPKFTDCADLDLEWAVNQTCRLLPPDPNNMSLKARQARMICSRDLVLKVQRNVELIVQARLFEPPNSGCEMHEEPKPAIYLAIVMMYAESTSAMQLIETLKAKKSKVCQPNVLDKNCPRIRNGGSKKKADVRSDTKKPALREEPMMDGSLTPRPRPGPLNCLIDGSEASTPSKKKTATEREKRKQDKHKSVARLWK